MAKLKFELLPSETVEVKKKFMRAQDRNSKVSAAADAFGAANRRGVFGEEGRLFESVHQCGGR